jgi:hypothetical protein
MKIRGKVLVALLVLGRNPKEARVVAEYTTQDYFNVHMLKIIRIPHVPPSKITNGVLE